MTDTTDTDLPADQQALLEAANALLLPLARLAVARGVHFSVIEARLKQAFVQAAREASHGGQPHRQVSRISTTTGINRREVTRLLGGSLHVTRPRRSLAGEVHLHWRTNPGYRDANGEPLVLPRQGPAPSFDSLARQITSDVHPRSMLDDMVRLGYAVLLDANDRVQYVKDAQIGTAELPRNLLVLADNVGAHMSGAVSNVLGTTPRHFDRALVANRVPDPALEQVRELLEAQWCLARDALVPLLEQLVRSEPASGAPPPTSRVLVGFYSHHRPDASDVPDASEDGSSPGTQP